MANFSDRLTAAIARCGTAAIVGIDPVLEHLPPELQPELAGLEDAAYALERFSCGIIEAVAELVPAVKINSAYFEVCYEMGVAAYHRCVNFAHRRGLLVIGDVKRGDVGHSAQQYAQAHLASSQFADAQPDRVPDAVTISGYLGYASVRPFIDVAQREGRGVYILVRPSDPSSDVVHEFGGLRPFYWHMAELVRHWGAGPDLMGNCGLSCIGAVVAAKDRESTRALRNAMPNTPFLVPGYGAQGGTAESCAACFRHSGDGAVISASRSIIHAWREPRYRDRYGDDWQACAAAAAREFSREIASVSRSG